MNWWQKEKNTVISELGLKPDIEESGLSDSQVKERIFKYGKNELKEKKRTPLLIRFFLQLNDFMVLVLLGAAGISFLTSFLSGHADFEDPIIILFIVSLNAILGLIQESKAEKSISALKKLTTPIVKVIRGGHLSTVKSEEIVPGDIIILETGDFVPADARLIESHNLQVEESALSGESVPVEKDPDYIAVGDSIGERKNMVFCSSSVTFGRGRAIVVSTGMDTEVGHIAKLISTDDSSQTPLQEKLANTGKILGLGALGICALIFFMGLLRRIPPFEMFMTSVSLAVAAIPEGLPAIVTIMLAIGVQRMAKRNAVIRKLPAVETLGSATVICSDKTGTLTQNKMKIVEISDGFKSVYREAGKRDEILTYVTICNDSVLEQDTVIGSPTEAPLVRAAYDFGVNKNVVDMIYRRVYEVPFDSKRKLMSTIHRYSGGFLTVTKGAPDFLLRKCSHYMSDGVKKPLGEGIRKKIIIEHEGMAQKALRVIGVAVAIHDSPPLEINELTVEKELTFYGLCGMMDPPREEIPEAVALCQKAGIKPVMVTGDHILTAEAIARKTGIMKDGDKSLTGEELSRLSDEELMESIYDYSVYARVSPEHKMRIVKAFQENGAIVAMTGDGVNDAPALKAADIGCAMGVTGTDVAKSAADMVLADDNFTTIVDAVREGRGIFENIRKAVHFLISSNIGEIITIFMAIFLGFESPLLAIQLLWVNLVTDSLPAIALGLEKTDKDVMSQKPYSSKKGLFPREMWQRICLEGAMVGMLALVAFAVGCTFFDQSGSVAVGRTMAFATLSISQLVHAFNMKSSKSIFTVGILDNKFLIGAFLIGIALQVSVIMSPPLSVIFKVIPLSLPMWGIVALLCIMPIVIVELEKLLYRSLNERKNKKAAAKSAAS